MKIIPLCCLTAAAFAVLLGICSMGKASQAVRLGDWKAVRNGLTSPLELYDLANDAGEQHDVAEAHPDLVEQMKEIIKREHIDNSTFPLSPPASKMRAKRPTEPAAEMEAGPAASGSTGEGEAPPSTAKHTGKGKKRTQP